MSYYVRTAAEIAPTPPAGYAGHAAGHGRDVLVGSHVGSVHTGFALCTLDPGGYIAPHLHSREESFYVLAGNPILELDGRAHRLAPDECGLIPLGATHSWRLPDGEAARWLEMTAPAPRVSGPPDTFFTGDAAGASSVSPLDIRDPRTRTFFRLDPGQMELENRKLGAPVDAPTVSASMATALLAYSGITLQMLVDQRLGAVLHTMFMVQYEPGGVAQPHDHPLEETYYILEGEVEALADGETIVLRAGDVFWTGVGCIHAFYNRSTSARVRWLETQSPQPPNNHFYRFDRDWDYLAARLPDEGSSALSPPRGETNAEARPPVVVERPEFLASMSAFPTGVTVVTTLDEHDAPVGLTCNAFLSVSAEPPLVLVSLDRTSNTLPALRRRGRFVVNFLAAGREEMATRCAGKARDKFVPIPWEPTFHGLPVLRDDSIAHVSCDVVEEVEAGDHVLFIGHVFEARPPEADAVPLLYFRRTFDRWPVVEP